MAKLVFIIAILTVGWLIYKLYFRQLLAEGKAGKIKIALIVVGLLFMILAVTGRAHVLFALIGAAMTQVMRLLPFAIRFFPQISKLMQGETPFGDGQRSRLRSKTLNVTLDHSSGLMDGEVIAGEFAGRRLSEMQSDELATLLETCQRQDPHAARLLLAYLARTRGGQYTGQDSSAGGTHPDTRLTNKEAYEILGIEKGATREEVIDAHRRLIAKMHPDKGGSNYLAAKINAAKKTLLDRDNQRNNVS